MLTGALASSRLVRSAHGKVPCFCELRWLSESFAVSFEAANFLSTAICFNVEASLEKSEGSVMRQAHFNTCQHEPIKK